MAKFEKTLHGDLDEIIRKICDGVPTLSEHTGKRDSWSATVGGIRYEMLIFEKNAPRVWVKDEHKDQAHPTLTIALIDDGKEIRLCAITAGANQAPYFIPGDGPEGGLLGALKLTLENKDQII